MKLDSKFSPLVDSLPALVWTANPNGDVDFASRQWCVYTGAKPDALLKRGWQTFIHPNDLPHWLTAWNPAEGARDAQAPWQVEMRLRRDDGAYRKFLLRAVPVDAQEDEPPRWCATAFDIDDHTRSEAAVRKAQSELAQILDGLPAIVAVFTPPGNITYCNRRMQDYLGETLEQIQAKDSAYNFHPDDRSEVLRQWALSVHSGQPFEGEARLCRADGIYRWHWTRVFPLRNAAGEIDLWYGLSIDIDEAKHAEAELRRTNEYLTVAQELSLTGSYARDVLTDEQNLSTQMYRIMDFDPAKKVTHDMVLGRIHPEDRPIFQGVQRAAFAAREDFKIAYRIVTDSGSVKHLRTFSRCVKDIKDRLVYVGATQDITEMKIAEEALHKARAEFSHVARALTLSALTASITHEVNQPLAGIMTNASACLRMLANDPPNVDGARMTAQRTIRDATRAADVIQRLRALFVRKQSSMDLVELNDAVREVLALSAHEMLRARVVVASELTNALPPIRGDRVQLQQVILNLILNAADAMREIDDRPRELLIATAREETNRVRLSVRDTGTGIEPQHAERIFDAFYTTKTEGMGIGLSISRSIIESHEGRIWATANDGPGATFAFSLPAQDGA